MTEIWKPVKGWCYYDVSSLGNVRSIDRELKTYSKYKGEYTRKYKGRILKRAIMSGYLAVHLRNGLKNHKTVRVHRIVAEAFIPNKDNKPCINHIDNNPKNNNVNNLEWCTQAENLSHARNQGRMRHQAAHINMLIEEELK